MPDLSTNRYPEPFQRLLASIRAAVEQDEIDLALAHADEAVAWGKKNGDLDAVDRALGNRAGFLVALGRTDGVGRELRAVLMRSSDPVNRHIAAYNLSLLYDVQKCHDKVRFYAGLALEQATKAGEDDWQARCHNVIANAEIAQSYFSEAHGSYRAALTLLPAGDRPDRAVILANLGYCELVLEQFEGGFGDLFRALRMMRRLGVDTDHLRSRVRLALSYGYIEIGRFARARRHALEALCAAERTHDEDYIKKSLYLLGEAEKSSGNGLRAYRHFDRLQADFFPHNSGLSDLLMSAQTHKLVNLMA